MKRLRLKNYDCNRSVVISYVIAKKMHHIEWCFFLPIAAFRLRRVVGDAIADLRFSESNEG